MHKMWCSCLGKERFTSPTWYQVESRSKKMWFKKKVLMKSQVCSMNQKETKSYLSTFNLVLQQFIPHHVIPHSAWGWLSAAGHFGPPAEGHAHSQTASHTVLPLRTNRKQSYRVHRGDAFHPLQSQRITQ